MARFGRLAAIWLLTILGPAPQAGAQDWSGRVRLQVGQEYDTNAVRENIPAAPDDFLTRLVAQGRFTFSTEGQRLWLDYQGGGKIFYQQRDENQVASRLQAGLRWRLPHQRSAGVRLTLRDVTQARHSRDYLQTGGEIFLDFEPLAWLSLEAWLGGHRYEFKPDGAGLFWLYTTEGKEEVLFSNAGPALGLQLHAQLGAAWSVGLSYNFGVRFFDDAAYEFLEPGTPEAEESCPAYNQEQQIGCYDDSIGRDRQDVRNAGGLSLRFKTAWFDNLQLIAQTSYRLTYNRSNSTGNSALWHRLRAVLSAQLPGDLTIHLMGTVQLTDYPDGRNLLLDFYEPDADENENSFVARVSWRFWDELSLVAQAAVYRGDFQFGTANQPTFARETVMLGLAWDTWF